MKQLMTRRGFGLLVLAVLLASSALVWLALAQRSNTAGVGVVGTGTTTAVGQVTGEPGVFDFYILVLSWAPDFCAANASSDPSECAPENKVGFVLHGLWPEYEQGYPTNCSSQTLPAEDRARFAGLYPSPDLIEHEWDKHGTCSGLSATEYFELISALKASVAIPPSLRTPTESFTGTAELITP
jgi:ribonuclease T2